MPGISNRGGESQSGSRTEGQALSAFTCERRGRCRCRILKHHARGAVRQRLLDLGLIPDTVVEVLRVATLGDPIEIKVGDSYLTLRKSEADQIEIIDR